MAENAVNKKELFHKDEYSASNSTINNAKHVQNGTVANGKYMEKIDFTNGYHHEPLPSQNLKNIAGEKLKHQYLINGAGQGINGNSRSQSSTTNGRLPNHTEIQPESRINDADISTNGVTSTGSSTNMKKTHRSVVLAEKITAADLHDLFTDKICVLHIPNYVPEMVCDKLDSFLREKGSDQYTHEVRKDGRADLLYFGVNRYGFPLNSTYNDDTSQSLNKYFSEALPVIRSIRNAAAPYLSPIDKLRVEMDEVWHKNVNIATLHGKKTFCGIGRIMPASLSELSADQPHFDAIPTTYFPNIYKQFAANIYLNVPEEGGELEIWDVPPVDVDNIENFTIPDNWRAKLPESIKVKPGAGDLLLLNTRRPHAVTKFVGAKPRTSIQTFIGLTKESDVFFWV